MSLVKATVEECWFHFRMAGRNERFRVLMVVPVGHGAGKRGWQSLN